LLQLLDSVTIKKDTIRNALNQYLVLAAPTRDFIDNRSTFRVPDSIIKVGYGLMEQDLAKMDSALSYKDIDALVSRLETLA
jgi:hypothetical protein